MPSLEARPVPNVKQLPGFTHIKIEKHHPGPKAWYALLPHAAKVDLCNAIWFYLQTWIFVFLLIHDAVYLLF